MKLTGQHQLPSLTAILLASTLVGCAHKHGHGISKIIADAPRPLGAQLNEINDIQLENAEAAKYIVYDNEFAFPPSEGNVDDAWRLNEAGEDHVKRIAVNLSRGDVFPVVVERSRITPKADTEFQYPIHHNEQLDLKRRAVVVSALQALGVEDADQRVIIAPAFAEGISGSEAKAAYTRSMSNFGRGGGGFGGGGFGGGGFGGGGFGGGGFF